MAIRNVSIAGATSNIGSAILKALLSSNQFNITALIRSDGGRGKLGEHSLELLKPRGTCNLYDAGEKSWQDNLKLHQRRHTFSNVSNLRPRQPKNSMSLESKIMDTGIKSDAATAADVSDNHSIAESVQEKQYEEVDVTPARQQEREGKPEYATGLRLFLVMLTINLAALLTVLEIGIIATAIPAITDEFHALDDVGWYGCATFLITASTSATWGKAFKNLNVKYLYLLSASIFLIGSLVAATAPDSVAVIWGRALQGLGITGKINGSIIVINYVSHPQRHPLLIGIWTAIFMIFTILGPIVGGALTSGVSWRWCFYINLPIGSPVLAMLIFFLRVPKHIKPVQATWKEVLLQLDLPGLSFILASLVCFALALQRSGQSEAWSNWVVTACLVLWICFTIVFVIVEKFQVARAMVPIDLMKPRVVWANVIWSFFANAAFYQALFYLPIYFQTIKSQSAMTSGVNTLPFLAFFAVGAMLSGTIVGKTRLLQPYQLTSALLLTAGMALIYSLEIDSSKAFYVGVEILFGFGIGFGNQIPIMAVQGQSKAEDVPTSTGIMFMTQSGSAVYFIIVAQSMFANRLLATVKVTAPNLNAMQVLSIGASDIRNSYSGEELSHILSAYMMGIKDVFACGLACAAFSVFLSLVVPFVKLPDHKSAETGEKETAVEA